MKVLDLFSGIGGFSLGLERAGMETVAFCEIEEYPCKVLAKHWPNIPIYKDVRELTYDKLKSDGIHRIDVITGGFPCQDLSVAGKQKGIDAERSGLWSEIARLISEIQPRYAIVENVTALLSGDSGRWFGRVLGDLAALGYDAEWHCISASELGAHHHRDRVWIIAYPKSKQNRWKVGPWVQQNIRSGKPKILCNTQIMFSNGSNNYRENSKTQVLKFRKSDSQNNVSNTIVLRQQGQREFIKPLFAEAIKNWKTINAESGCISGIWSVESELGRVANGIPDRAYRLKGLGNAVVPQIPELIGMAIMNINSEVK
ncbi:MAG: DNA (cytosine-5-)-methyltransferase [Methylococcales bacterium]|nr:DNA (cytosine-5-)-methyltransferase [Methylococcales bacterium]